MPMLVPSAAAGNAAAPPAVAITRTRFAITTITSAMPAMVAAKPGRPALLSTVAEMTKSAKAAMPKTSTPRAGAPAR